MESKAYNMDCMEGMKQYPDKYFDLAVVDPPYGGGADDNEYRGAIVGRFGGRFDKYHLGQPGEREREKTPQIKVSRTGGTWAAKYSQKGGAFSRDETGAHFVGRGRSKRYADMHLGKDIRHWDYAPPPEYFDELMRISKNQIIWGGNYFSLPPTRCFLIWRKLTISENFTMAMAEYAWTSFNDNAKVFEYAPQDSKRFHPTQKPKALYDWIFGKYAKPGMKIIDTHLGSGSSRLAAYDAGLDFVGYEIDKFYFEKQEQRFANYTAQTNLFIDSF